MQTQIGLFIWCYLYSQFLCSLFFSHAAQNRPTMKMRWLIWTDTRPAALCVLRAFASHWTIFTVTTSSKRLKFEITSRLFHRCLNVCHECVLLELYFYFIYSFSVPPFRRFANNRTDSITNGVSSAHTVSKSNTVGHEFKFNPNSISLIIIDQRFSSHRSKFICELYLRSTLYRSLSLSRSCLHRILFCKPIGKC